MAMGSPSGPSAMNSSPTATSPGVGEVGLVDLEDGVVVALAERLVGLDREDAACRPP